MAITLLDSIFALAFDLSICMCNVTIRPIYGVCNAIRYVCVIQAFAKLDTVCIRMIQAFAKLGMLCVHDTSIRNLGHYTCMRYVCMIQAFAKVDTGCIPMTQAFAKLDT